MFLYQIYKKHNLIRFTKLWVKYFSVTSQRWAIITLHRFCLGQIKIHICKINFLYFQTKLFFTHERPLYNQTTHTWKEEFNYETQIFTGKIFFWKLITSTCTLITIIILLSITTTFSIKLSLIWTFGTNISTLYSTIPMYCIAIISADK